MEREKPPPEPGHDPVATYKALLRELVDRRPSGTRQKIAAAIGKHKSFVSQITNPGYSMPIPAKHLAPIFDLCHFTAEERRSILDAYEQAHPGRSVPGAAPGRGHTTVLAVQMPRLKDCRRQAELAAAVRRVADEMGALARRWDDAAHATSSTDEDGSEA